MSDDKTGGLFDRHCHRLGHHPVGLEHVVKPEDLKAELVKNYYIMLEAACECMDDPKSASLEAEMHLKAARAFRKEVEALGGSVKPFHTGGKVEPLSFEMENAFRDTWDTAARLARERVGDLSISPEPANPDSVPILENHDPEHTHLFYSFGSDRPLRCRCGEVDPEQGRVVVDSDDDGVSDDGAHWHTWESTAGGPHQRCTGCGEGRNGATGVFDHTEAGGRVPVVCTRCHHRFESDMLLATHACVQR